MNKLNTFIDFFKYLWLTVPKRPESKIDKLIEICMNESINFNIYDLIDEIEKELGRHNNPKLFIQRILLRFENISKFLLINLEKEYTTSLGKEVILINGTTYYEDHIFTHKTLESYFCWYGQMIGNVDDLSIFHRYVIDSFDDFNHFFTLLDKLCSHYEINIIEIQKEKNVIIWIRDLNNLLQNENTPKLKSIMSKKHEKTNEITDIKKELHNDIFKGNAFEVFKKYHETKFLAENCKTDLSVLFQLFEKDNLFTDNTELKHYIKWLNKTYNYAIVTLKKVDINTRPNTLRTKDYKAYKETTLK